MFRLSEKLLHPFPEGEPETLPRSFFGFVWACTVGLRGYIVLLALQTIVKHQTLAINFPLRLRWNFHRMMLGQSLAFYADEFAGRITTKVMQTALAVREMLVVIGIGVYFITILGLLAAFDTRLMLPFLAWFALYAVAVRYFVPRLGRIGKMQADARAMMTGRITDACTNISTVVMDQGRIVEEGTHRELLAQGGLYARLWSHQSGGFLGESEEEALAA